MYALLLDRTVNFRWGGGGDGKRALPASVGSQLPSAQNNPSPQVTYLGVAYSNPLQSLKSSLYHITQVQNPQAITRVMRVTQPPSFTPRQNQFVQPPCSKPRLSPTVHLGLQQPSPAQPVPSLSCDLLHIQ